jgi:hypothetical protein
MGPCRDSDRYLRVDQSLSTCRNNGLDSTSRCAVINGSGQHDIHLTRTCTNRTPRSGEPRVGNLPLSDTRFTRSWDTGPKGVSSESDILRFLS